MNMTKGNEVMARQVDVLAFSATYKAITPEHVKEQREGGAIVVAVGETSMHAHVMRDPNVCLLRREGVSDRVLTVESLLADLILEGGESAPGVPRHGTISIPQGVHLVRVQREWTGEGVRN